MKDSSPGVVQKTGSVMGQGQEHSSSGYTGRRGFGQEDPGNHNPPCLPESPLNTGKSSPQLGGLVLGCFCLQ